MPTKIKEYPPIFWLHFGVLLLLILTWFLLTWWMIVIVAVLLQIQYFMTQPMFVAESYVGKKGAYVKIGETLDDCEKIIDGRMDDRPEEEFYMIGRIK